TVLDRFNLDGKVAVVTGASSGLGVQFAQSLAEAGADVALGARRLDRLHDTQALVAATGRRAIAVECDVTKPEDCDRLVERTIEEFGSVDILVNNAGVAAAVPSTRETPEQFRSVFDVNLFGAYWMAQSCARVMTPGSAIVNIGSVVGYMSAGLPQAAYSASKTALIGLTRDLAQQWSGRKGIRVNTLALGWFPTDMTAAHQDGYLDDIAARAPLGRLGDPEEAAAALVFLASAAASYITGTVLLADGGILAA
ncbi:MAG TPA: SDR family oxidoreductase, partial [Ilumatobacter sp.]|nr:SDR family oxidoreductase [Ilumatobacter sp.]